VWTAMGQRERRWSKDDCIDYRGLSEDRLVSMQTAMG